jgi:hypothetical protein
MTGILKILPFLFIPLISVAQSKKIKTFETSETIAAIYIDRAGDIYLKSEQGQIQKFSEDGTLKGVYKTNPAPTLFDPRDGSRLFAFYRESRSYDYLTPSFSITSSYKIDSAFVIEPWLVCSSGDANLWLIEAADGRLKKINPKSGEIEIEAKLDLTLNIRDIITMREYQGFVFILIKGKGIVVFNGMGKLIRTIEERTIGSFNFLGEELYYKVGENLLFFDLFSAETRNVKLPAVCEMVIVTDERMYLMHGKGVDIYSFKL